MKQTNTYNYPRGSFSLIARACGCSREMVRSVLTDRRPPKTSRAKKSIMITEKAAELRRFISTDTK